MLPENEYESSFHSSIIEFVPQDTLRAIYTLRNARIGVPLAPPFPPVLVDLLDTADKAESRAENLIADLEHLAVKRGSMRRKIIVEERQNLAQGKNSVLPRLLKDQRTADEEIQLLSAQVTLACEDASTAKAKVRSSLPQLWSEWHSELASAASLLKTRALEQRNDVVDTLYALQNTVSQLAVIDSQFAPLAERTHSGLTIRNVAQIAREVYHDAFSSALFHLERLEFDLPERTQPAEWFSWALARGESTYQQCPPD